jgi:hypothetical protein
MRREHEKTATELFETANHLQESIGVKYPFEYDEDKIKCMCVRMASRQGRLLGRLA